MNKIKIFTIIPTLNANDTIEDLLTRLQKQSIRPNILLIDSHSIDDTVSIARENKVDILKIEQKEFNHARTRNLALKYDADFYLFMTQDAIPFDENLLQSLINSFEDTDVIVSYARQIPLPNAHIIEKFARETNYPDVSTIKSKDSLKELGIKTFFCSNSCAMYRVSYFKEVGGFTEGLIMNEDMEFVARAIISGKKVAYQADAKVWHSHEYGVCDIFKRYFDIGIFFKTTPWIQNEVNKYSSTESTGIKQAKVELVYLLKNSPLSIPKSILFSLSKFVAFKFGYQYDRLPLSIKKFVSLHKNFHL